MEEVVDEDVEDLETEVAAVGAVAEDLVTVAEAAAVVVVEAAVEGEEEAVVEWVEERKSSSSLTVTQESLLPEARRMLSSQRIWPSEIPSMAKSVSPLRKKVVCLPVNKFEYPV